MIRAGMALGVATLAIVLGGAVSQVNAADWPQWQGINRDAQSAEKGLMQEWPKEGPTLAWQMEGMGKGFSSVAVVGDKLYTMGDRKDAQYILAFDLAAKKELWAVKVGKGWGDGSRCTPTVDGDLVFGIGTSGDLVCVQGGKELWRKNFGTDFGGKMMSGWGYSESPLVDGDNLICTPGGKDAMMVALNKKTGETVWKCAMPTGGKGNDGAGYSSVVISGGGGVKQYVQNTGRGLVGVAAKDGKLLWRNDKICGGTAHIPTAAVSGDYVFGANGYGGGGLTLKLETAEGGVKATEVNYLDGGKFQNHHGGVVIVGDYVYAGSGHGQGEPACISLKTGKIVWKAKAPAGGSAAIAYADGQVYLRYEDGQMVLMAASPDAFKSDGQFKLAVINGTSWSHPVISSGKLYLRANDVLMCYDIAKK